MNNGEEVYKFLLKNKDCEIEIISLGAIITSIKVPDKNGKLLDVALGFNSLEPYLNEHPYFGAIIGRYANRIDNGKFTVDDVEYNLALNNNGTSLHGGIKGFDKVNWKVVSYDDKTYTSIKLNYLSKDMEEGYPGNLNVYVTYKLTNENELVIQYNAETDKKTILNLTQHSYFNLSGESSGDVSDHNLEIYADSYLPVNEKIIPTGDIEKVQGTPFDFVKSKKIGRDINLDHYQLSLGNGYDHCWVLNDFDGSVRKIASAYSDQSGIQMDVYTDQPGVQLYTGNFLNGSISSKQGSKYEKRSGFCLETQHFPDSPNKESFPNVYLKPGEVFKSKTVFKFIF
tara:strand:- start:299 stop:1321 length:1023 start_codon:yes stop_codon:yes gene_type:complete